MWSLVTMSYLNSNTMHVCLCSVPFNTVSLHSINNDYIHGITYAVPGFSDIAIECILEACYHLQKLSIKFQKMKLLELIKYCKINQPKNKPMCF